MKQTTVLKALNTMNEKRVSEFLNDDVRDFGEIIEALCDEVEVDYVEFMYELIQKCKTIEAEEKNKAVGNLVKSLDSNNYVTIKRNETILTDEQSKKFYEVFKNYHPPLQFDLPKIDLSNIVVRRNN